MTCPREYQGAIIEKMGPRKADMASLHPIAETVRFEFIIPARGLIGLRSELMTETRGTAVMTHIFHEYAPYRGDLPGRKNGVLLALEHGHSPLPIPLTRCSRGAFFLSARESRFMPG